MPSFLFGLNACKLASPGYVELQRELHARPEGYGGKGDKWASGVAELVKTFGATSVLDYGAGSRNLAKALRPMLSSVVRIDEYDPAVPEIRQLPSFADLVTCTDVLEHIEPDRLSIVLQHLYVLARKAVFVVIATRPSNKTMADGRNAHLILESDDWWSERLMETGFVIEDGPKSPLLKVSREFVAVLTPAGVSA